MATETLRADGVVANSACVNPANAQGAPNGVWTGNTDNTNWDCRWSLGNPTDPLTSGHTSHTAAVLVRKSAAGGNGDPTVALELWSNGVLVRELVAATSVTSTTGVTLQNTFTTAEAGPGADLQVRLVVVGVGGSPAGRRNVQADGFTVTVDTTVASSSFTGVLSAIQDDQTSSASGTASPPGFSGVSAVTQDNQASAASGMASTPSATGSLAVTQNDQTSAATGDILKYAVFRRTPQTGAAFDPDVDTLIADVATSPYVDLDLSPAGYDYQVFRRVGAGWSVGSNVEQVVVTAGAFTGVLAVTQDDQTVTASGTGDTPGVDGIIAAVQDDQTSAASGAVVPPAFSGTAVSIQDDDTSSASGTVAPPEYTGTSAATQDAQTSTASGAVGEPSFTGTLDVTAQDQFSTASGSVVNAGISGALTALQENQVATASGTFTPPSFTGTADPAQDDQIITASGMVTAPGATGTIASIQDDQTSVASGSVIVAGITGSLAVTQDDHTSTATGGHVPAYSGTLTVTQDDQTLSTSGDVQALTFWTPNPAVYAALTPGTTETEPLYTPVRSGDPSPW